MTAVVPGGKFAWAVTMVNGPVPPVIVMTPVKLASPWVQLLLDMWLIVGVGLIVMLKVWLALSPAES